MNWLSTRDLPAFFSCDPVCQLVQRGVYISATNLRKHTSISIFAIILISYFTSNLYDRIDRGVVYSLSFIFQCYFLCAAYCIEIYNFIMFIHTF